MRQPGLTAAGTGGELTGTRLLSTLLFEMVRAGTGLTEGRSRSV
jgi:hypothetical protein